MRPRPVVLSLAVLALTACGAGEPGDVPMTTLPPVGGGVPPAAETPGVDAAAEVSLPASCAAIELVEGARIASEELATCLTDYLRHAGSGRITSEQDGSVSEQRWALTDAGLYAVGTRDGRTGVVVTPDDGWLRDGDGWVHADAGGTVPERQAADGVEMYRTTSEPVMTYAVVSPAPGFTVGGREEVELPNGDTASLWAIRADGPFQPFAGLPFTTQELVLWTDVPGPTVRMRTVGDVVADDGTTTTGTSVRTYTDWGAADLDEIAELTGSPVPTGE